jgi:hypothetical protein
MRRSQNGKRGVDITAKLAWMTMLGVDFSSFWGYFNASVRTFPSRRCVLGSSVGLGKMGHGFTL